MESSYIHTHSYSLYLFIIVCNLQRVRRPKSFLHFIINNFLEYVPDKRLHRKALTQCDKTHREVGGNHTDQSSWSSK